VTTVMKLTRAEQYNVKVFSTDFSDKS